MITEPEWLEQATILAAHDLSLAEHGGPPGVRDLGLLQSALDRPRNRFAYEEDVDLPDLAATYAVAIAGNHPFVDGNKRTAFIACAAFLRRNGLRLIASEPDATETMLRVASGQIDEAALASWLRLNITASG